MEASVTDETRHFVAYHNTERMGGSLAAGNPFRVLTNKPVAPLHENVVWFVVGEGKAPRRYALGSVFRVTETGNAADEGFGHFAEGRGHLFDPPIPLNDLEWFNGFLQSAGRFQFGVQPIREESHIAALKALAIQNGATLLFRLE
jgi:hypothetical protein